MAFLILAYPQLSSDDFAMIQDYRKDHDGLYYQVVDPHFTIVFPVLDMPEEIFVSEAIEKASGSGKIDFAIRCATVNKDAFSTYYHTFLVPDEGYSRIVKLHDKMYSGKLMDQLRLDIDFVPHIGIGNSTDKYKCKSMADEWNKQSFCIKGHISKLEIVRYENNRVSHLESIVLE